MINRQSIALMLNVLIISAFVSMPALAQTPAEAYAQSSPIAIMQRTSVLLSDYDAASDIMKANVARRIATEVKPLRQDPAAASIVAQADIILSRHAALDGRKNLALRQARNAEALASTIATPEGRTLRVRAASAVARALIAEGDFLNAVKTTSAARRAFGPLGVNSDPAIDELEMWDAVIRVVTPSRLAAQVQSLAIPQSEAEALANSGSPECVIGGVDIQRNRDVGLAPTFPVESLLRGVRGGGVVTRSTVDENGRVLRIVTTAYSPSEGFAAAAEQAARTWQYNLPRGIPEVCRSNLRTVFSFGTR